MNRNRDGKFSPPAVGGVTLLVVFSVLCLTIFALLSLSTIQANGRLSDASENAVVDYYDADGKAQEILARLRTGQPLPENIDIKSENGVYSYICKISDTQNLEVSVRVNGSDYRILKWQTAPSGEWHIDNTLNVWNGDFSGEQAPDKTAK